MPAKSLPYRRGVGVMLVSRAGKVLVAERIDTPGAWQMPQGGIDRGETPRRAARRELKEEIGTARARIIAETRGWLRYDLPAALRGKVWKGKYRGQEQKWFLMLFTGRDDDIDLAGDHPEFARWKWVALSRVPKLIVGFKRALYLRVAEAFADRVGVLAAARPVRPRQARDGKRARAAR